MWTALLLITLGVLAAGGLYHLTPRHAEASAPAIYAERCSQCHGAAGRGDGIAGVSLEPRPRDFANAEWQKSIGDERIEQTIREAEPRWA